ncbi:MAG: hypothetical protein REJ23_07255 [Brevundimonas sp.]|nr:hypothetical protein [Brevundimonas sp.]
MKLITLGALVFGGTLIVATPVAVFGLPSNVTFSPLKPNPDIPTFAESVAASNDVHADEAEGSADRNQIRRAVIQRARALRAAPCNAGAKAAYLAAVSAYSVAKMEAVRAGEEDQWRTALDDQFGQVTDQQVMDGFVTMRESGQAMMAGARQGWLGRMVRDNGEAGASDWDGPGACERHQAGEVLPQLKLEHPRARPQPAPVSSDRENQATLLRVARESANTALDKDPCSADGRRAMLSGLSYYYEMRHSRRSFWPKDAGPDRYIDGRVTSLIRRGKLQHSELPRWVALAAPGVAATSGVAGPVCRDGR